MTRQYKTKVYLSKMKSCPNNDNHEPMEGVLYQRCKKCGNIFTVRDLAFIKKQGELGRQDDYVEL